jgi:VWFA-related protein
MGYSFPRQIVVAMAVVCGVAASSAAPRLLAQARERTLFVSAMDKDGKPIEGLGPDAFVVREDGNRREVLRVSRATEPIDVALLVDNSTAASEEIVFFRQALSAFVARMAPRGQVAVVTLADRPTIRVDYTNDAPRLTESVGSIFPQPQSGMTLLDALTEVARGLGRRETPRAVIVPVITDGVEFTNTYHRDVITAVKNARAAVHLVTIGQFYFSNDDRGARERSFFLEQGSSESGGQRITLLSPMGLPQAMDKLAAELLSQYKVVYSRPQSLIQPEKITVESARPNVEMHGAPARGENGD